MTALEDGNRLTGPARPASVAEPRTVSGTSPTAVPGPGRATRPGPSLTVQTTAEATGLPVPELRLRFTISAGHRGDRNLGDLGALAADIRRRGLLHPVSVTAGGALVIGARRLAASAAAGMDIIPCRVVTTVADAIAVIRWENADDTETGDSRHHLPATIAALAAQDLAIRELAWWERRRPGAGGGLTDHRDELAAAYNGPGETRFINNTQYSHLRCIALAATWREGPQSGKGAPSRLSPAARSEAQAILALLDHRDTRLINAARDRWRESSPATPRSSAVPARAAYRSRLRKSRRGTAKERKTP